MVVILCLLMTDCSFLSINSQKNSRARRQDVDTAAVGFLRGRIYLRTVFWQDMPFLHRLVPDHPVFSTEPFQQHWHQWTSWRKMMIEFVENMESLQNSLLCPPIPFVAPASTPDVHLSTMAEWVESHAEEIMRKFAPQVCSISYLQ